MARLHLFCSSLDGVGSDILGFVIMPTQTGFSASLGQPQLSLFSVPQIDNVAIPQAQQVKAPCRTTEKLMAVLEEITGWKTEFEESGASYRRRSQDEAVDLPAEGTFSIVDMSADWPANKFTAHRGKCDQLVRLVSDLVGELQSAKLEVSRLRSVLAVMPGGSAEGLGDEDLVDSFIPKFNRVETGNVGFDSKGVGRNGRVVGPMNETVFDDGILEVCDGEFYEVGDDEFLDEFV